jgi:hypothetical protein
VCHAQLVLIARKVRRFNALQGQSLQGVQVHVLYVLLGRIRKVGEYYVKNVLVENIALIMEQLLL